MAERKHSVNKLLRLNTYEAKVLGIKASEAGMTETAYLRMLISQKPNDYPEIRKMLNALINEINHIGVNINQIVHNNNSEFYARVDKENLKAYMNKIHVELKKVVDLIGNQ